MSPKRFYVIGDPIAHSLSPVMHRAAFRVLDLPHTYETMLVTAAQLPGVLDRVRRGDIHGLNVTVPHKVEAMRLCDVLSDEAHAVGAVNTLHVDATGRLVGSNTDCDGLRADLAGEGVRPKRVLLLGTGGAARAAAVAMRGLGAELGIAGRDDAAARALAHAVGAGVAVPWSTLTAGDPWDLVINATSAGMEGGPDGAAIADAWARAPRTADAVAYDLVYRPAVTPFLARAAADGARAIGGLGMLVEQGARALSIFLAPPAQPARPIEPAVRRAMREAVEAALGARQG
ncbi:MAG: shikimate dehydrogenase [Deltaproteobacteria bacterium]|nr:shikimate dehydrogenase [Deltaproteobacteria bacterium]